MPGLLRSLACSGRRSRRGRRGGSSLQVVYNIIPEVIAAVEANAREAVAQSALEIAADARSRAPVETGRLRSSIEASSAGKEGIVSVGAEHGPFVEYGTYKMAARPFLSPSVAANEETFKDRVGKGWLAEF